ncbi:hypothetical protein C0J52_01275 [Blattella germanica]|nr:hypothetical protein C0J52_01275 [Blattella germanica]
MRNNTTRACNTPNLVDCAENWSNTATAALKHSSDFVHRRVQSKQQQQQQCVETLTCHLDISQSALSIY